MNDTQADRLQVVTSFYADGAETTRLDSGMAQLEAVRTRQLVTRHAPTAPATVLDVGGGAGSHAFWLAERGYAVHLLDLVPALVDAAARQSTGMPRPLASVREGDARSLPFADATADVVLLLGPLYHLTAIGDRMRALAEAARVLRPGGVLFAAGISRWASALYGLAHGLYAQPGFDAAVARVLRDGQNANPSGLRGAFTTAYFHRPAELAAEVADAGFVGGMVEGLEGAACLLPDFDVRWRDPVQRQTMERLADELGTEPSLLGVSAHLLAIAWKAPASDSPAA